MFVLRYSLCGWTFDLHKKNASSGMILNSLRILDHMDIVCGQLKDRICLWNEFVHLLKFILMIFVASLLVTMPCLVESV